MCAMGEVFGLHPWDIDRLTVHQLDMYEAYLKAREEATRRG